MSAPRLVAARRAFTLVELLIVIVVLGILIAIVVPSFVGARDAARNAQATSAVTVGYHNAKASWVRTDAYPDEDVLADALNDAEPSFAFRTATPTSGDPQEVWVDTDALAMSDQDLTLCAHSRSGRWFCLRADESGTLLTTTGSGTPATASHLAADGPTLARSSASTLADALCGLPDADHAAGARPGCEAWTGATDWSDGSRDVAGADAGDLPDNVVAPSVTGTPIVGESLTATDGTWTAGPVSATYVWQRNYGIGWENIAFAIHPTYVLTPDDAGATMRVVVVATNLAGYSPGAPSNVVGPVSTGVPVLLSPPLVNGDAQVGETLSVGTGTWSGSPSTYAYQWEAFSGGAWSDIAGATSAAFTVPPAQLGAPLRVRVVATNSYGSTTHTTDPTGVVTQLVPTAAFGAVPDAADPDLAETITWTSTGATTTECRLDGVAWATCSSPRTLSELSFGAHTFDVRVSNGAGSATISHTWDVVVSTTIPNGDFAWGTHSGNIPGSTVAYWTRTGPPHSPSCYNLPVWYASGDLRVFSCHPSLGSHTITSGPFIATGGDVTYGVLASSMGGASGQFRLRLVDDDDATVYADTGILTPTPFVGSVASSFTGLGAATGKQVRLVIDVGKTTSDATTFPTVQFDGFSQAP